MSLTVDSSTPSGLFNPDSFSKEEAHIPFVSSALSAFDPSASSQKRGFSAVEVKGFPEGSPFSSGIESIKKVRRDQNLGPCSSLDAMEEESFEESDYTVSSAIFDKPLIDVLEALKKDPRVQEDINYPLAIKDSEERLSALGCAVQAKKLLLIIHLIEKMGASVEGIGQESTHSSNERTALWKALRLPLSVASIEIIKYLLSKGASTHIEFSYKGMENVSLFKELALEGDFSSLQVLILSGANLKTPRRTGIEPFYGRLSKKSHLHEMVDLLVDGCLEKKPYSYSPCRSKSILNIIEHLIENNAEIDKSQASKEINEAIVELEEDSMDANINKKIEFLNKALNALSDS